MGQAAKLDPAAAPGREVETVLWSRDGISVHRLQAWYDPFPWTATAPTLSWGITLIRRGAFGRQVQGVEQLVDVNTGFFRCLGEEVAGAGFFTAPEELTIVRVEEDVLDDLPDLTVASGPLRVTPEVDLSHRLLLRAVDDDDGGDLGAQAAVVELVHECLAANLPVTREYSRKSTERARHRLVRDTCELLHAAEHRIGLIELGRTVGSSPFHLSRVFREITGMTISQYRLRLRVHDALDRIAAGDDDLAGVAAAAGFADHSHLTRTVVTQFGQAPSALRHLLRERSPYA